MTRPDVDIDWVWTTFQGVILDKEVSNYMFIEKDLNNISKMVGHVSNTKVDVINIRVVLIDVAGWWIRGKVVMIP